LTVTPSTDGAVRRAATSQRGAIPLAYLTVVIVSCLAAGWLAPQDPTTNDLTRVLEGPSLAHLLGTDQLGRDVLSRLLYGGRSTFAGLAEAMIVVVAIGVPGGILAGYRGGPLDAIIGRCVDVVLSIPAIVVVLTVLAVVGASQTDAMITVGFLLAPGLLRVVRAATIDTRHELYVAAARVSGLTDRQIMSRHIAPRIAAPALVNASLTTVTVLLVQTGLAFLGLTVQSPHPSWGGMVTDASQVLQEQPWLLVPSGGAIALTALAFVLLGDAVADAAPDPPDSNDRRGRRDGRGEQYLVPSGLDPGSAVGSPGQLLSVRELSVELPLGTGWTTVLDKVSFDIDGGETLALVGESGAGKSVSALALLGLIPAGGRISHGSIEFNGQQLRGLAPQSYRQIRGRQIAYIAQEPISSLDPSFTIGSQLLEAVRQHAGGSRRQARARVFELLEQAALPEPERVVKQFPHQLSGGMAQRVVIARALAGRPALVIADEPTTALDATVQREILALLASIQRQTGMSILLITHDWRVAAELGHRAIVMYAGQVIERGASIDAILHAPRHPYTSALIAADTHLAEPGERIRTTPGVLPAPGAWPIGCRFADRCRLRTESCELAPISLVQLPGDGAARCIHLDRTDPSPTAPASL
jgi:peptide/nickel transport system permease protein